eukprot:TRINITY_DN11727_c0_g1_i1.p1 TRINITY_DN11727_c0_g1~~TRINITY_DN11727_c0_g1_i1.p1  ORF type:complete len:423 (+),score=79.04 TRINITY_DN11727_c0_g1_i1:105-1373(+)
MSPEEIENVFKFPEGLEMDRQRTYSKGCLSDYSIFKPNDPDKAEVLDKLMNDKFDKKLDRAIGCILGMVTGDSLGAPLEFSSVRYGSTELKGLDHVEIWAHRNYNRFDLKPGQWTDDASMGLCLADSLLVSKGWNPLDCRLRFLNWWTFGYCNAFGKDGKAGSVGLGGNISQSFSEFEKKRTEYTTAGDIFTSGNGSVMRLAAVPIYYAHDIKQAEDFAYKQSKTTHQGEEAAECCRLMSHIIVKGIHGDGTKDFLGDLSEFQSAVYSIQCLASSKAEETHESNAKLDLIDRNWNWKDPKYRYSPTRSKSQPGYVGSYAMDALSMALHCVWTTNSLTEAMLKCANMRGDADSVCSVAGQIAGAIYGASSIPKSWIKAVLQWDNDGEVALRGYKLFTKRHVELPTVSKEVDVASPSTETPENQ